MLQDTNLLIVASQLPPTFAGDPNFFFRSILERMKIVSASGTAFFVVSDLEPSSNQGPWLKGGTQWWVWDEQLKRYVPLDISESETKWFQVGSTTPATADPPVWLKTTEDQTQAHPQPGNPIGWYLYNGTTWVGFTELFDNEVTQSKIADKNVTFPKIQDGVENALFAFDSSKRPTVIIPTTDGFVLSLVAGVPTWSQAKGVPVFLDSIETVFNSGAAQDWTRYDSGGVPTTASAVILSCKWSIDGPAVAQPEVLIRTQLGENEYTFVQTSAIDGDDRGASQSIFPMVVLGGFAGFDFKITAPGFINQCLVEVIGYLA